MCYEILLNNVRVTTVIAKDYQEALEIASKRYGLTIEIREIPCHQGFIDD